MKTLSTLAALLFAGPLFAGGAIGGSTGAKCHEYLRISPEEFHQLVDEVLSNRSLIIYGENMRMESLDLSERMLEMRSLQDKDFVVVIQADGK